MVRCTVDLRLAGRVSPAPFVGDDGRAIAWVEIDGGADIALYGTPADLRGLASAASTAADGADRLLAIADQLPAEAGPAGTQHGG